MHKTNIKLENTAYLLFRHNLLDAQPHYAYFLCKTIEPKFSEHLQTEIGGASQPKPKFYAQHLSNSIPNRLNAHKCEETRVKSVCTLR